MANSAGVSKVLEKLQKNVDAGNYYEAQQMIKTVYHRHKAKKQTAESYQILKGGAVMQLTHNQVTCGVELGLMLIEAYVNDKVEADDQHVQDSLDIIRAFPAVAPSASSSDAASGQAADEAGVNNTVVTALDELSRYIGAHVKWALKQHNSRASRLAQDLFAQYIWLTYGWRYMGRASLHYARGHDAGLYAAALHECSTKASPSEADLLICRAVLQALATASSKRTAGQQLSYARDLLASYLKLQGGSLDTSLVHFVTLLLEALGKRSLSLERLLRQKYEAVLSRDPTLGAYLGIVEKVYLGVGADAGGPLGGMLGSMLKEMLGGEGGEDDDEDDEDDDDEYDDAEGDEDQAR